MFIEIFKKNSCKFLDFPDIFIKIPDKIREIFNATLK